jgi:hypothetical protein
LGYRPARGNFPFLSPGPERCQPSDQSTHHFFVRVGEEEIQRQNVIDDHARRKQSNSLLRPTGRPKNVVHQIAGNEARQYTYTDAIRQRDPTNIFCIHAIRHKT